MKIKVVVIDDKPIIRRAIVETIDWEGLGCVVAGQAENGIEGKQVISETEPELLITDIKMPGLSGLDLAEWMQDAFPDSKTILITGYQEFEYAKRAIRHGVHDFIVKPIKNAELYEIVRSAVVQLQQVKEEKGERTKMAKQVEMLEQQHTSSIPSLRSKLAADLIAGVIDGEAALQEALKPLELDCSRVSVLLLRVQGGGEAVGRAASGSTSGVQARLIETAVAAGAKRDIDVIEGFGNDWLVLVCGFRKVITPREARIKLQGICTELAAVFGASSTGTPVNQLTVKKTGVPCRIAVSSLYKSLLDLPEAVREASDTLSRSFFLSEEMIFFPMDEQGRSGGGKFSIMHDLEQFNQVIEHASHEDLIVHLETFLGKIKAYSDGNIVVVKGLLSEVCLATARYFFRVTGDEFGLHKSVDQLLDEVYRLASMRDAQEYLAAFIRDIKSKLKGGEKEYSLVVKKVIDYINGHFFDNISLTSVAEHFALSPSYLSRLLRTETGINFVDLVSKARIEAAKRLLKEPKYKVNEVGEMVGFKEYAYFYQVFKRVEGISPKEFKNGSKEI